MEARCGSKIDQANPCAIWLVGYLADLIKRYKVGSDGKTSWERVRGKKFKSALVEIGENIRYIRPESVGKNKWEVRWEEGIFIEIRDTSGEYIIGAGEGVIKARGIIIIPDLKKSDGIGRDFVL